VGNTRAQQRAARCALATATSSSQIRLYHTTFCAFCARCAARMHCVTRGLAYSTSYPFRQRTTAPRAHATCTTPPGYSPFRAPTAAATAVYRKKHTSRCASLRGPCRTGRGRATALPAHSNSPHCYLPSPAQHYARAINTGACLKRGWQTPRLSPRSIARHCHSLLRPGCVFATPYRAAGCRVAHGRFTL